MTESAPVLEPERIEHGRWEHHEYTRVAHHLSQWEPIRRHLDARTFDLWWSMAPIEQRVPPKHDGELGQEVIEHLEGLDRQAHEEGIEISAPVRAEVERILRALDTRRMLPYDVDVFPSEDGQVAIEARSAGAAFTLYCEPDKSALCLVTVNRVSRRARYQDSGQLPDCFVEEALRDLADQASPTWVPFRMTRPSPAHASRVNKRVG